MRGPAWWIWGPLSVLAFAIGCVGGTDDPEPLPDPDPLPEETEGIGLATALFLTLDRIYPPAFEQSIAVISSSGPCERTGTYSISGSTEDYATEGSGVAADLVYELSNCGVLQENDREVSFTGTVGAEGGYFDWSYYGSEVSLGYSSAALSYQGTFEGVPASGEGCTVTLSRNDHPGLIDYSGTICGLPVSYQSEDE